MKKIFTSSLLLVFWVGLLSLFPQVLEAQNPTVTYQVADGQESLATLLAETGSYFNKKTVPSGTQLDNTYSRVSFKVTPLTSCRVVKWVINGEDVTYATHSSDFRYSWGYSSPEKMLSLEFTVKQDVDIVVHLEAVDPSEVKYQVDYFSTYDQREYVTLTATANGEPFLNGADISPKAELVFTATPAQGYLVDRWVMMPELSGISYSEDKTTLTITEERTENLTVMVYVKEDPSQITMHEVSFAAAPGQETFGTIYARSYPKAGGVGSMVSSGSAVREESTVQFTITPADGYCVDKVMDGTTDVTSQLTVDKLSRIYTVQSLMAPVNLEVIYKEQAGSYQVAYEIGEEPLGLQSMTAKWYDMDWNEHPMASGDYVPSAINRVELRVTTLPTHQIKRLVVNGVEDTDAANRQDYVYRADGNLSEHINILVDLMELPKYTVMYGLYDGSTDQMGRIEGFYVTEDYEEEAIPSGAEMNQGTFLSFIATPKVGYQVDKWYENNQPASSWTEGMSFYRPDELRADLDVRVSFKPADKKEHNVNYMTVGGYGTSYIFATVTSPSGETTDYYSGAGGIAPGSTITLAASVDEKDAIVGWTYNKDIPNVSISEDQTTLTVTNLSYDWVDLDFTLEVKKSKFRVWYSTTFESPFDSGEIEVTANGAPVSTGDYLLDGTEVTFTAKPNPGYVFDGWYLNFSAEPIADATEVYTAKIEGDDLRVSAQFAKDEVAGHQVQFTVTAGQEAFGSITAKSIPAGGGDATTLTSGDAVKEGSKVLFDIVPAQGYEVDKVMEGTTDVTAMLTADGVSRFYVVNSIAAPVTLEASFKPAVVAQEYAVTYSVAEGQEDCGMVDGMQGEGNTADFFYSGDLIAEGTPITINIVSNMGYEVDKVMDGDQDVTSLLEITETPWGDVYRYKFTLSKETNVVVYFKSTVVAQEYPVSFATAEGQEDWGMVDGMKGEGNTAEFFNSGDLIAEGTPITINIVSNTGYELDKVMDGDQDVTSLLEITETQWSNVYRYRFTLSKETNVVVYFKSTTATQEYAITYSVAEGQEDMGMIDAVQGDTPEAFDSGTLLAEGTSVVISATPNKGYVLDKVMAGGRDVTSALTSTEAQWGTIYRYQFTVAQDLDVVAYFKPVPVEKFAVTFSAGVNGTLKAEVNGVAINSGDQVEKGTEVVFTATPDQKYEVSYWTVDGTKVEEQVITRTITVEAATTIEVFFQEGAGIEDLDAVHVKAFINNDQLVITGLDQDVAVALYSLSGERLISEVTRTGFSVAHLADGVYLVQIGQRAFKVIK